MSYTERRAVGLSRQTINWLRKAEQILWNCTKGEISKTTADVLRQYVLCKYVDVYAKRKVINFSKAFFRYLAKTRFDTRYQAFELFLEMPKALKERKHVTSRVVTKDDVGNVLKAIEQAHNNGRVDSYHYLNYKALVLFGAFTGQRPLATIARLTVGQFKEALKLEKPVVNIFPEQDKIRMQHYCPLHPQVVEAILPVVEGRFDDERVFEQLSFQEWLKYTDIRLLQGGARIVNGDLRKFAEQQSDLLQWDQSNRAYILTHSVSGVSWSNYRHPLPENVYDIYMEHWQKSISLTNPVTELDLAAEAFARILKQQSMTCGRLNVLGRDLESNDLVAVLYESVQVLLWPVQAYSETGSS